MFLYIHVEYWNDKNERKEMKKKKEWHRDSEKISKQLMKDEPYEQQQKNQIK